MRAALDVHKRTIVCASQPDDPRAGELKLEEIPNTERALRGLVKRLGGPDGLAVCHEAGPCGFEPLRLLAGMGAACDVVAPSLVPVRTGDRVKTDRRDAKKLLVLYRAGALSFVSPPTTEQEGLRDLVRCRQDLVAARRAARHRIQKQLVRHGLIFGGKKTWTLAYCSSLRRGGRRDPPRILVGLRCDSTRVPRVRGNSRPETVLRFRPAHLRATSRRLHRAGRPAPAKPPP